jgi:hypothetical protein
MPTFSHFLQELVVEEVIGGDHQDVFLLDHPTLRAVLDFNVGHVDRPCDKPYLNLREPVSIRILELL